MSQDLSRRQLVGWLATLPFAGAILPAIAAAERATAPGEGPFVPKFFTAHEWRTVRVLVDFIIPRDERSGSATDAHVPEFMDFMMIDQPALRDPMRGGLHWLDAYCIDKFGVPFVGAVPAQQKQALDAIAYANSAAPEVSPGVAFFASLRNLTASGFWTSKMGMADLQYIGNAVVHEWNGCPPEALVKLGVSYS
jgi:gluconate 2-dehydrogenase gamma chain